MSRWSPADVRRVQLEVARRKPGRPPSEYRLRYQLRHSADQMAAWKSAAAAEGRELQNWIRWHLDRAAAKTAKR